MDMSYFNQEMEEHVKNGSDVLFVADTIEELAEKTGIDKEGLTETLKQYNEACQSGFDQEFNKKRRYLKPIDGHKFYALKFAPSAYGSMGGIKINEKTEGITEQADKIPGLYAAGTDAYSICNPDYVFVLPGNSLGFAVNSGRMAGKHAIEYIKSLD